MLSHTPLRSACLERRCDREPMWPHGGVQCMLWASVRGWWSGQCHVPVTSVSLGGGMSLCVRAPAAHRPQVLFWTRWVWFVCSCTGPGSWLCQHQPEHGIPLASLVAASVRGGVEGSVKTWCGAPGMTRPTVLRPDPNRLSAGTGPGHH